jgi:type IV secretion system protein VirB4
MAGTSGVFACERLLMAARSTQAMPRRDHAAAVHVPYTAHVTNSLVATRSGDYVQAWRILGVAFESTNQTQIDVWYEQLNLLWRNIASPQVALWTHVIRRREPIDRTAQGSHGFARDLEMRYRARLATETLRVNEIYLALVYRPGANMAGQTLRRMLRRTSRRLEDVNRCEAIDACGKLADSLQAALEHYQPQALTIYAGATRHGSAILEYFAELLNGESQPMPLPQAPLAEVLATSRVYFGAEAMEYRAATSTRLGAFLGIKEYPATTSAGVFDRLLTASFPFVFTQSFTFLSKATALGLLKHQARRLRNAGDHAITQAEALEDALDQLAGNDFVMGDHHASLHVLTEPATDDELASPARRERLRSLHESLAAARTILAEAGAVVAREDLALEAAYWAQLPGNFAFRPRKAPITSRNFAAMAPFHNFPSGRAAGNHWGPALAVLATRAGSPYHFSLHAGDPRTADGGSRRDTGHTFICGPTGSGKTVFLGFCLAMLQRQLVTQVVFDKDRGLEILVRACGGEYLRFERGVASGMNPLALPATADHREFLRLWLRRLVTRPERALSTREEKDLDESLGGVMALEPAARRLSRLLEFLPPVDPEGLHARLAPWCASCRGEEAWVFDAGADRIGPLLARHALLGIDVSSLLESEQLRAPVVLYLFHMVRQLLDGRRLVVWMDEFERLLVDPAFMEFAKDGLKTWRKRNAVAAFATQSASDVVDNPIARTLIEQTPTKIFFPNANASRTEYVSGLGLSEREYALVREALQPGTRTFLIKQDRESVPAVLDLKGFELELDVISGRTANLAVLERVMQEVGQDPAAWLPRFAQERVAASPSA